MGDMATGDLQRFSKIGLRGAGRGTELTDGTLLGGLAEDTGAGGDLNTVLATAKEFFFSFSKEWLFAYSGKDAASGFLGDQTTDAVEAVDEIGGVWNCE